MFEKKKTTEMQAKISDAYGRTFQTLRISLTHLCNFACTYCVAGEVNQPLPTQQKQIALSYVQLADIVERLNGILEFTSVRLTGGEPTLYPYLLPLIELLSSIGIKNISMTTNGLLLRSKMEAMVRAGLNGINVSLDALSPVISRSITRRGKLTEVVEGIHSAIEYGITIKINSVIMRGVNEHEILPLLRFAMTRNIPIRFIELMRMGHLYSSQYEKYFFSMNEILDAVQKEFSIRSSYRPPSATAKYWQLDNGYEFGIIANVSDPFCSDCNRLRLDQFGNIYGCLSESKREYIADTITDKLQSIQKLEKALTHKQPMKFKGSLMKMIEIGG